MKILTAKLIISVTGFITGIAMQMNWMANQSVVSDYGLVEVVLRLACGAVITPLVFWRFHFWVMKRTAAGLPDAAARQLELWSACSFIPAMLTVFGVIGIVMTAELVTAIIGTMVAINLLGQLRSRSGYSLAQGNGGLGLLFLVSGFAALIYQVAWQRTLFATFGINIESVALVVSVFMFGLGIGALLGGMLSERFSHRLRELFFIFEAAIGVFGLVSIAIIRTASDVIIHGSPFSIGLTVFAILCLPTMMMGATLPILVTHINQTRKNLGNSVGWLYFSNTMGSALAALLTVTVIFPAVGLQNAVWIAAALNFVVAGLVIVITKSDEGAVVGKPIKAS